LTKDRALQESLTSDYHAAPIDGRDMAMLTYSEKLTVDPCNTTRDDFLRVKEAGFDDDQVLDIVQIVAYYNYVNRLACGLGVELESHWKDDTP
jgi:uncharacterized peroxidase-related enzyme